MCRAAAKVMAAHFLATCSAWASTPTPNSPAHEGHRDKIGNTSYMTTSTTTGVPPWRKTNLVIVNPGFAPHAWRNSSVAKPLRPSSLNITTKAAAGVSSKMAAVLIFWTVKHLDFARLQSLPPVLQEFQRHVRETLASEVGYWIPPDWIKLQLTPGSVRVRARLEAFSKDEADAWHADLGASVVPLGRRLVLSISSVPGISAACTGNIAVTDVTTARAVELAEPAEPGEDMLGSSSNIQTPGLEAAPFLLMVAAGGASCLLLVLLLVPLPSFLSSFFTTRCPSHAAQAPGGPNDASKQYAMLSGQFGLGVFAATTRIHQTPRGLAARPLNEKKVVQDCTDEADPEQQKLQELLQQQPLQQQQPQTPPQQSSSPAEDPSVKTARSRGWSSIFEVLPEQEPPAQRQPNVFARRPRGESDTDGLLLA